MCVYSDELLKNKGEEIIIDKTTKSVTDSEGLTSDNWSDKKARINGTTSYMPAMFGMTIASLVVQAIEKEANTI
jgi:tRNA A37 threonylcarbamoyladenosine dehydratase